MTTGGSSLRAINVTEQEGLVVKGVIALLDRLEGGREAIEEEGLSLQVDIYSQRYKATGITY